MIFATPRLIIRDYCPADRPVLAAIAALPRVRAFLVGGISRVESDGFIDRQIETIRDLGCGYAVLQRRDDGAVLGDVGIRPLPASIPFFREGLFEIGWQLDPQYFGRGYATEAARGWLGYGFETLGLDEVVSYTAQANEPSINVMKRIGMTRQSARDFDHPKAPHGHPMARQLVYGIFPSPRETATT